jgi:hypothetical protein
MPRKYTKRSEYWEKFPKKDESLENLMSQQSQSSNEEIVPATAGESYYTQASCPRNVGQVSGERATRTRSNRAATAKRVDKYKNIADSALPYSYSKNYISPKDSILLCQKAYANVPIFRNAVDVMAEFSNSDVYLEGGSEKSKSFIDKWLNKIQIWKLKDQYFREYYRSGNVFLYKLDGKFTSEDLVKLNQVYGSEANTLSARKIPIKYIFLNPYDFVADRVLTFSSKRGIYKKLLSEYDIEKLKDPQTEYDKEVFDALPPEAKDNIKNNQFMQEGVLVNLDAKKLIFSFYKKQDYEPFAIPFGFPVLDDINWKMELKKIDQAITKTIENVILLVTMGNTPDKGGINPNNLKAMQQLFQNESIGRALIADYTTKAEFIIPDLNKVLGPTKYQIVNEDIKEGLQNIIVGKENYSSTQVKAQIFLERLKEARHTFLNDVLQPQIKEVCKMMGFKNFPTAKFVEIDIKDEVQLQRVASRLIEMGIITPEQGMTALKKGVYPDPKDLRVAQERFVEDREKGYYTPLSISQPILPDGEDLPKGANPPKVSNDIGRPAGTKTKTNNLIASEEDLYARRNIQQIIYATEELQKHAEKELRGHYNKKRLSKEQKEMAHDLAESVIISKEKDEWETEVSACVSDFNKIEKLEVMPEILDLSQQHEIVSYPAALLYHSKKINTEKE